MTVCERDNPRLTPLCAYLKKQTTHIANTAAYVRHLHNEPSISLVKRSFITSPSFSKEDTFDFQSQPCSRRKNEFPTNASKLNDPTPNGNARLHVIVLFKLSSFIHFFFFLFSSAIEKNNGYSKTNRLN